MEEQTFYRARVVHSALAKQLTVHIKERWFSGWREYSIYTYTDKHSTHNTQPFELAQERAIERAKSLTETVTVFDSRKG